MFSDKQIKQLNHLGIEDSQIELQLKYFNEGFEPANLSKPAVVGDGILKPDDKQIDTWIQEFDEFSKTSKIIKFVPASGAASRMFKPLYEEIESPGKSNDAKQVLQNITKLAFYNQLKLSLSKKGIDIDKPENATKVLKEIIDPQGLNYGSLPKGLLLFHSYLNGSRTPVEEHLIESIKHATSKDGLHLHFTISPEHEKDFTAEFGRLKELYEKETNRKIEISNSFQKKSTDTIAVDLNNNPILDENELLTFRPGGHGALLENLNDLDADLFFIKNIDNIVPDYLKPITVRYKKALAGFLIQFKNQVAEILTFMEWHDTYSDKRRNDISAFMEKYLGIKVPENIDHSIFAGYVKSKLDKPIRICGMVKNVGEPGGGPFWVLNRKGELKLQIIESSQVNLNDAKQKEIFNSATHFNPVDLVCYVKDYSGHKFNLLKYRDSSTGFISGKSLNGKKIKVQELPGLWNGSMAHWITLFVEVPIETFNPVKTINDLLRKEHQPKG